MTRHSSSRIARHEYTSHVTRHTSDVTSWVCALLLALFPGVLDRILMELRIDARARLLVIPQRATSKHSGDEMKIMPILNSGVKTIHVCNSAQLFAQLASQKCLAHGVDVALRELDSANMIAQTARIVGCTSQGSHWRLAWADCMRLITSRRLIMTRSQPKHKGAGGAKNLKKLLKKSFKSPGS